MVTAASLSAGALASFAAIGGAVAAGYVGADLFSGIAHWAIDNYAHGTMPSFIGAAADEFQMHHKT